MAANANEVRIIGGRHRGRRLCFVPRRGLRPTPGRVRETLFNWLRAEIDGAFCLDLFAGSGALGLEALSRGAAGLTAVESDRVVAQRLRDNLALMGDSGIADVVQTSVERYLGRAAPRRFDVVFVDPPFAAGWLPKVCRRLESGGWLASSALIYLEQDVAHAWPPLPPSWQVLREGAVGQSAQRLLRRNNSG